MNNYSPTEPSTICVIPKYTGLTLGSLREGYWYIYIYDLLLHPHFPEFHCLFDTRMQREANLDSQQNYAFVSSCFGNLTTILFRRLCYYPYRTPIISHNDHVTLFTCQHVNNYLIGFNYKSLTQNTTFQSSPYNTPIVMYLVSNTFIKHSICLHLGSSSQKKLKSEKLWARFKPSFNSICSSHIVKVRAWCHGSLQRYEYTNPEEGF